jgi:hypothetical protein
VTVVSHLVLQHLHAISTVVSHLVLQHLHAISTHLVSNIHMHARIIVNYHQKKMRPAHSSMVLKSLHIVMGLNTSST